MVSKSEVYMGIDPGIADTGFGFIRKEAGKMICLSYGSIKTSSKKDLNERLVELHDSLNELIIRFKPDMVGVEELFFCKNVKTALVVGQARGVILLTTKQHKLPLFEFTPLQVKQAVSSYGKADKGQVQRMVKILLNLKIIPRPDDAADALAIAICAANSLKI
jgi:crossover junction endodeoxyribonuclease RuvC